MGQLRTALHAYALEDHGPGRTLELVDRYVQAMPDSAMATAAYAVLDTNTGMRPWPAPATCPRSSSPGCGRLEMTPGRRWGRFRRVVRRAEVALGPSEMLVLYTDGLVERPASR